MHFDEFIKSIDLSNHLKFITITYLITNCSLPSDFFKNLIIQSLHYIMIFTFNIDILFILVIVIIYCFKMEIEEKNR